MSKKNKKEKYSTGDHVFAILIVFLMFVFIISSPFLIFLGVFKFVSLFPYISINTTSTFDSVLALFKFFFLTVVVVGVVDIVFSQILMKKKGPFNFALEAVLMFVVFYLYVLVYSFNSQDIVIRDTGVLWVSLFLFILYLLFALVYPVSKRIYGLMMKKIQDKNN
ncbi:hypothetical protein IHP27_18880 [Bacillus safensis]|uniref:hypothetical protein n=1 Tax=Bacillus safensis TaxID=561879 RepID=UPI001B3A7442|nr:hypothetical protein [Bacillus safensis]MBQ4843882.1 hypothetical protein [Bacillus safensis]MBQ4874471.1 hypothetical protein [Bacillus safensis]MBQ4888210.1 hypothetical protein [Bacillus safensis]